MRWLLLKDLQILRRSPLQAVLLVLYPILIAVLVGFAISRDPDQPRVAFLNEVPADSRISVGDEQLPSSNVSDRICRRVECVEVADREQAEAKVSSGDVLAALILPANLVDQINSLATFTPGTPTVEVLLNEEDPVKAGLVNDRIDALLAQANLAIARRIAAEGSRYLELVINGGSLELLGQRFPILGLSASAQILEALELLDSQPRASLRAGQPVRLRGARQPRRRRAADRPSGAADRGRRKWCGRLPPPPLEIFAVVAAAATLTLAFVTVLLVAGSLALEREENAFPRLTRGLVSREALLAEKVLLGLAVGLVVTLLLLAGMAVFVPLQWDRFALWLTASTRSAAAALAAARSVLGAAAREVRAVSLLAFMVTLPVALLSLVPSGAVSGGAYDAIRIVTAVFPFKPALQASDRGTIDSDRLGDRGPADPPVRS